MRSVVVTGGAGYIGSHVCLSLKQAGFLPVVVDNLSQGHEWAIQWGPFVLGDIFDKSLIKSIVHKFSPVGIIHLASHINVRESILHPAKYYRTNLLATFSLLEALMEEKLSLPFIFSSSAAVYAASCSSLIDENQPLGPLNPYGASKLMAEKIIHDFSSAYGFSYAILRYFNAAGADAQSSVGEAHTPETHLIPRALLTLFNQEKPLPIYGDGTAVRDYIHVTDLAEAHVKTLLYLLNSPKQQLTLNLGTGKGYSLKQVLSRIEFLTNSKIPVQKQAAYANEPSFLVADAKKAYLLLNWRPQLSDLDTIIQTAFNWHKKVALL